MTERERLIELLDDYTENLSARDLHKADFAEKFADFLLKSGVFVPPCKVGDVVYMPIITDDTHELAIWDITISQISIEKGKLLDEAYAIGTICKSESGISFDFNDIGKTVFLTKEGAEAALKGVVA